MTEKVRVGVIPAAGEGKRMGYLSNIIPKCLFPLYDKPIIHHVIENMVKVGIEKIVIPTCFKKEKIFDYFDNVRNDIAADIHLLALDETPKGIALSIASAKAYVDEPFMVILGDDVTIGASLLPLVKLFLSQKAVAVEGVIQEKNKEILRNTCCVRLERNKQISSIEEKPENPNSDLRGCGTYVFDPAIFGYIEKTPPSLPRNEVEITNTIGLVAREGKAYGELINGININVNTPDDLFAAWVAVRSKAVRKNGSW